LYKLDTLLLKTKEVACIGYYRFLFPHEYKCYKCGERNPLYPKWDASFVFNSIVLYL